MHGPHALANTVAPMERSDSIWPSRSMVALTRSDPGVTISGTFARAPFAIAWFATSAARLISSLDEFVQLPINVAETSFMKSFDLSPTSLAN